MEKVIKNGMIGRKINYAGHEIPPKCPHLLRRIYNDWNKKAFDNKLPYDIELAYARIKGCGGKAYMTGEFYRKRRGIPQGIKHVDTVKIEISNILEMDMDTLLGIILHEMVHIYDYTVEKRLNSHNYRFQRKLQEIMDNHGVHIPMDTDINPITDPKKVGIIMGRYPNGENVYSLVSHGVMARDIEKYIKTNLKGDFVIHQLGKMNLFHGDCEVKVEYGFINTNRGDVLKVGRKIIGGVSGWYSDWDETKFPLDWIDKNEHIFKLKDGLIIN